jgi:hypothetical protein
MIYCHVIGVGKIVYLNAEKMKKYSVEKGGKFDEIDRSRKKIYLNCKSQVISFVLHSPEDKKRVF